MGTMSYTPPAPKYGQVTCTTAGTVYALATAPAACANVTIKALAGNTGKIYIGNSAVTSSTGFELTAGQMITLPIADVSAFYAVAASSGDKVCFIAY